MSDRSRGCRLLIVGNPEPTHVGAHLLAAAESLGIACTLCDTRLASQGSVVLRKWSWLFRDRQPPRFRWLGGHVMDVCRQFQPTCLLATGLAPLGGPTLRAIGALGALRLNFLTDDPWNPAHRADWFLAGLPEYDRVFSPRRSNLGNLAQAGCPWASYLPFAYVPGLHFPESPSDAAERQRLASDVLFVGGADADRVPYIEALLAAGYRIALYGGYWQRRRRTRPFARGQAGPETLRKATTCAKVSLCLVRRANRDGHVMRTYEIAASGGCMLAEDTEEHREILGPEGEAVLYFRTPSEMVAQTRRLLGAESERRRLAEALHRRITAGANTYRDRLAAMLANVRDESLIPQSGSVC